MTKQEKRHLVVAVSGASGLVGSSVVAALSEAGHEVRRLVRRPTGTGVEEIEWDHEREQIEAVKLEGIDAVIHLAGENIAAGRWTKKRKQRIVDSRVKGTRFLADVLGSLDQPPGVFVCASATGFYGNRGQERVTESSGPGTGFLAETCRAWEQSADPARDAKIRTVHLRIGVVLAKNGGALAKMITPFRLRLGGVMGSGRQGVSWIALDDLVRAVHHVMVSEKIRGPVNAVSPNPVSNREFTKTLGKLLQRATIARLPGFAARILLGEMAREVLLSGAYVIPEALLKTGFEFQYPILADALSAELQRA